MYVKDVMRSEVTSAPKGTPVQEAFETMRDGGFRHLPVVEDGAVVGILSDRDLRRAKGRGQLDLMLVRDLMTPDPERARPDQRLSSVALILSAERIGAMPVVVGDRLVGVVSLIDVIVPCTRALQRHG